MEYKKVVSIILINPQKEILLQLRDDKPSISAPGYWAFIEGGVDEGENLDDAIKREVKEEIEIDIEDIEQVGKIFVKKDEIHKDNYEETIFKGKIDIPVSEIKLNEGQKVKYFKLKDLENIKFLKCVLDFIQKNKYKIFR